MSQSSRNHEAELASVMNTLAESVAELSDAEVFEEVRLDGLSPEHEAAEIKALLKNTVKNFQQRRLREAQRLYEENAKAHFEQAAQLPPTAEARRALLYGVLNHRPEIGAAILTTQHREFTELSDDDVESYLRQLHQLGALDLMTEAGNDE